MLQKSLYTAIVATTVFSAQIGLWAATKQMQWQTTDVDTVRNLAWASSLALDGEGNAHIAYHDTVGVLKYASRNGDSWIVELVDTTKNTGSFVSLALDAQDKPHIAYAYMAEISVSDKPGSYALRYASKSDGTWTIETVDKSGDVGQVSLALDGEGHPHIAYHDTNYSELNYAVKRGTNWAIETPDLADKVGLDASLMLDSHGNAHIAYRHETEFTPPPDIAPEYGRNKYDLRYASNVGGSWKIRQVDVTGSVGWGASLALDTTDKPHIAYYEMTKWMRESSLKYATDTGENWKVETVDTGLGNPDNASLALDALGNPHIAYYDGTEYNLKYASKSAAGWTRETVDPGPQVGWYSSLKLDAHGNPRIAYWAWVTEKLKYAWLN